MKIVIISPPFGEKGEKSDNLQMAPPILEYLASLVYQITTDIEVELVDANREDVSVDKINGGFVVFSALTPQAPWVYRTADALRKLGKKVIIGGMHVTALPEEGKLHADTIIIGEVEGILAKMLDDAAHNRLSQFYYGEKLPLENIPERRRGLLKNKYRFDSFFTARNAHSAPSGSFSAIQSDTGRYLK